MKWQESGPSISTSLQNAGHHHQRVTGNVWHSLKERPLFHQSLGAEATVSKLSFNYSKYPPWVSNFSGSDKVFALNIKFPLKICKYSGELMPEQKFPPLLAKFTYLSNFSFLHFLWRTYNVFFISIILLILKVKILALLFEHGSENIWIRV